MEQTRRTIDRACEYGLDLETRAPGFCVLCPSVFGLSWSVLTLLEEHPLVLPDQKCLTNKV